MLSKCINGYRKSFLSFGSLFLIAFIFIAICPSANAVMAVAPTNPGGTGTGGDADGTTGIGFPGDNMGPMLCDPHLDNQLAGNMPVGLNPSQCLRALDRLRLGMKLPGDKYTVSMAQKTVGSDGQESVKFVPGGMKTWKEVYDKVAELTNTFINNHMDYDGSHGPLLTRSGNSAGGVPNTNPQDFGKEETTPNNVYTSSGQKRDAYSTTYSDNKAAIADGACQMIARPGAHYTVTPLKDGRYQMSGASNVDTSAKASLASMTQSNSMNSANPQARISHPLLTDVEAILDTASPWSPRHYTNWTDKQSPSFALAMLSKDYPQDMQAAGGIGGGAAAKAKLMSTEAWAYTYTWVCGGKKFPNAYMFTHIAPPKRDEAYNGGFDYYKKPLDNGGMILVNDATLSHPLSPDVDKDRDGKFRNQYAPEWVKFYIECYAICTAASAGYGAGYCQNYCMKVATESAEHELCRKLILPPVTPINHLKMAYNLAPNGPGPGSQDASATPAMPGTGVSSFIYAENRAGLPNAYAPQTASGATQYDDEGMSWYFANPSKQFGYNMPPLKNWSTGLPASKTAVLEVGATPYPPDPDPTGGSTPDPKLARLEPWRMAIVGVNRDYMPDESNDMEEGTHNMSAQYGGWKELKLYYARCGSWFGLNCLCDYEKSFFRGSSVGYAAFFRPGAVVNIGNEEKQRQTNIGAAAPPGYEDYVRKPFGMVAQDLTDRAFIGFRIPVNKGKARAFWPILGMPQSPSNTKNWPGIEPLHGLDKAERDKQYIAFYTKKQSKSSGQIAQRPWVAMYVEQVRGDGCLRVSIADNGTQPDAAMSTENWGLVTERVICPPDGVPGAGSSGSSSGAMFASFKVNGMPLVGKDKLPPCTRVNIGQCTEEEWKDWDLYPFDQDQRRFDSFTGNEI